MTTIDEHRKVREERKNKKVIQRKFSLKIVTCKLYQKDTLIRYETKDSWNIWEYSKK